MTASRSGQGDAGWLLQEPATDPGHARTWPSLRLAHDESLPRLAGQGLRLRQQATRRRCALARDLARLQNRAPEGWPRLQPRAPPLTLRGTAQAVGRRGVSARRRRRGPKGQRKAAGARHAMVLWRPASYGRKLHRSTVSAAVARRFGMKGDQSRARRAERALEVVCRASPHRADGPVTACDFDPDLATRSSQSDHMGGTRGALRRPRRTGPGRRSPHRVVARWGSEQAGGSAADGSARARNHRDRPVTSTWSR